MKRIVRILAVRSIAWIGLGRLIALRVTLSVRHIARTKRCKIRRCDEVANSAESRWAWKTEDQTAHAIPANPAESAPVAQVWSTIAVWIQG
jgi:hypothetical protein